jgi:DNA-binding MltR family transcriptional regulator
MSGNLASEMSHLISVLNQESDRGLVLAGAAYIDDCLKALLKASLIEDTKVTDALLGTDGSLSTFASRMKLAYLLGLLEVDEYRDLELIRKMRNECAHSHQEVDLSRSPYRDRILELKGFQKNLDLMKEELDQKLTEKGQEPRNQLLTAIGFLCAWLGWRAEHANRPSIPNLIDLKREALRLAGKEVNQYSTDRNINS